MISTSHLSDLFVEVADTLVDDFDLIDFLHHVATNASRDHLEHRRGSHARRPRGEPAVHGRVQRGRPPARALPAPELRGPCLDAHDTGEEVADIMIEESTERWPVFAPRAIELGLRSAHCFPLRLRDQVIGAMNTFRAEALPMNPEERRVARALADLATIGLMQERALRRAEELTEQLQFALNSRIVIEQAKGAVAGH